MRTASARFGTIDALRGVAAIAVMLFHADGDTPIEMPGGYLAVDLFFALSGFVIAHSYASRLDKGMPFATFMRLRAARLWPMLALGAILGIVLHGGHAGMLFLLPNPNSPDMLYPANPPFWSLLLEIIGYAAFALLWGRIGVRGLGTIITASAVTLVIASVGGNKLLSFGAEWQGMVPGLARLAFAFGMGVAIWHLRKGARDRQVTPFAWALPAIFLFAAWISGQTNPPGLIVIFLLVPALTWFASHWEIPQSRIAAALGDCSYPLYCIHVPLIASAQAAGAPVWTVLLALPAFALWLDRAVDAPLRRLARRALIRNPSPNRASAA